MHNIVNLLTIDLICLLYHQNLTASKSSGKRRQCTENREHGTLEGGTYAEALNNFEAHRTWLASLQPATQYEHMNDKKVEAWIVALKQNKNPFDKATLAALR